MIKKKNPDTVRMPKGPENSNKGLPLFYKQSITQTPNQTHSTLLKLCHITTLHTITAFGINGWGPTNQLLKQFTHTYLLCKLMCPKLQHIHKHILTIKLVIICLLKNLTMNQSSFIIVFNLLQIEIVQISFSEDLLWVSNFCLNMISIS